MDYNRLIEEKNLSKKGKYLILLVTLFLASNTETSP